MRVGLIGSGQVARAHAFAYANVNLLHPKLLREPVLSVVAELDNSLASDAMRKLGFSEATDDWKKVTSSNEIDLVDIVTPTFLHSEQTIDAAEHGKHILCEKPLATTASKAKQSYEAARKAGIVNIVGFNYRKLPAVIFAKKILDEGTIGKLQEFRASFLEDWANTTMPRTWRFEKVKAGGGVLADLGSHIIDLARFFAGDIKSVVGTQRTFIQKRSLPSQPGKKGKSDVDDSTAALLKFKNTNVIGRIDSSWCAQGRKVFLEFEVNGADGSLYFNLERPNELSVYTPNDHKDKQGFRTLLMGPAHPLGDSIVFPAPGAGLGYADSLVQQAYELLHSIEDGNVHAQPTFFDGWKVCEVIEAIQKSNLSREWVDL